MPRTTKQNEQIREAAKTTIIESALILFAQKGYATTNMRQIGQQAGVSTGLTYHYFDSKQSLLRAVFEHSMLLLSEAFAPAAAIADPKQRMNALLNVIFTKLETDRDFWSLFYMLRTQPAIMTVLGDDFRHWTTELRAIFVMTLQEMKRPSAELDAYLLYSLIEGTIQQYLLDPENYPLAMIVDHILEPYSE